MFKWITGFGLLSALLLGVLYTPYSANAASIHDDLFNEPVDSIQVTDFGDFTGTIDVSLNWSQYINQDAVNGDTVTYTGNSNISALREALSDRNENTQGWSVIQYGSSIRVTVDDDNDNLYYFYDDSGTSQLMTSGGAYMVTYSWYDDTNIMNLQIDYQSSNFVAYNGYDASYSYPFLMNINIDYPDGYEGVIPPDTYTPPTPPLGWTPDIQHVQSIDWKILLQDRNFNTFDPVPFTCNEGLTPVIQYDLFNNDTNEEIDSGVFSPTIQYQFQAEKYGTETEFKFIGNYYCGDLEDDPTFSGQTTYYFTLNASGTFVPDTPSCFSDTFPYIDIDGCTSVIEDLINNLSFGTINFPEWEINSDGCHTLGILGDWINVPSSSRTICPQFSPTVRNVVTPFLTFVLGITIIGVLVTKSRNDFN